MQNVLSLLMYLLLACLSAFIASLADKKNKKLIIVIPVIILSIISGFRAESVGVDTHTYQVAIYTYLHKGAIYVDHEFLFYEISAFILRIFGSQSAVLLAWSILTISLFFSAIWENRSYIKVSAAVFLFVVFYYGGTMNGIRQFISISVVIWSSKFLKRRHYLKFILAVAFASLFHRSALIALICPFVAIGKREAYTPKELFICTISIIGGIAAVALIFQGYWTDSSESRQMDIGFMMSIRLGIYLLTYAIYRKARKHSPPVVKQDCTPEMSEYAFFDIVFLLALMGHLLALGSAYIKFASRAGYYFRTFEILAYGFFFQSEAVDVPIKTILFLLLALLGVYSLWNYNGIIPYLVVS